ncbi:M13-type metalloendopeptidase [Caulobacter segnis]
MIDGMTGDQRFFLAFARGWRDKSRDDSLETADGFTDPHSPSELSGSSVRRATSTPAYAAFGVKPGDTFHHLPPEKRSRIG